MLKFDFIYPYRPLQKCGIASDVGAAMVSGGTSLLGGIFGYDSAESQMDANIREAEKNRQFNREEAEKNRNWQSEQADIARNWQSNEWSRQFGFTNQEWQRRFAQENSQWFKQQQYEQNLAYNYWMKQQAYNSPAQQVQRGIEAGINPAASLGTAYGSTGLSAAPTSVASPAVSAPATPSTPMPSGDSASIGNTANIAVSKADAFSKMASGFSDIISAITKGSKDVADTKTANAMRDSIVKAAAEDVTNKQLLNEWQQLENGFQSKAIPKRLEKLGNEARNLLAAAMLAQTEEELKQCQIVSEQFRQSILDKEDKYKAQDLIIITATASNIDRAIQLKNDLMKEQAKTERARQSESYASVYEHTEAAKLHISQQNYTDMQTNLTSLKSVFQSLENAIKKNEVKLSDIGLEQKELDNLIYQIEQSKRLEDIKDNWNLWNYVRRVQNQLGIGVSVGIHN